MDAEHLYKWLSDHFERGIHIPRFSFCQKLQLFLTGKYDVSGIVYGHILVKKMIWDMLVI